jgi:hypothetical protein
MVGPVENSTSPPVAGIAKDLIVLLNSTQDGPQWSLPGKRGRNSPIGRVPTSENSNDAVGSAAFRSNNMLFHTPGVERNVREAEGNIAELNLVDANAWFFHSCQGERAAI